MINFNNDNLFNGLLIHNQGLYSTKKNSILIYTLIFIAFTFCAKKIKAQYNTDFLNYSKVGRSISINLDFDAGGNGASNEFINKLVFGGYISNSLKDESLANLNLKNKLGINLNYSLSSFIKGNSKVDYLIGYKNQELINATYTKDFYTLLFYGNKSYKGKTANLEGCSINSMRFQELKFGLILNHIDSLGKIGVSISLLKGEDLFSIQTNKNSSLFTSIDGNEIIFNPNFNMEISDSNKNSLTSFKGIGGSADIFFETTYKSNLGKKSMLTLNANNIGFIHWLENTLQYNSDSSFHFTGYTVNSIFDLKDSAINYLNKDSLTRNLSTVNKKSFNTKIPTNLIIINKIFFGKEHFALSTGFRYIFNANYKPYFFIEPEYNYKNIIFGFHTGYGGYVNLNIGATITWNNKDWFLKIGSNSLQGFILPKSTFGQGVYFSFAKKFN